MEVKGYIQIANVKHTISETLESIKESIKSLQIIDEVPNIHLFETHYNLGN